LEKFRSIYDVLVVACVDEQSTPLFLMSCYCS